MESRPKESTSRASQADADHTDPTRKQSTTPDARKQSTTPDTRKQSTTPDTRKQSTTPEKLTPTGQSRSRLNSSEYFNNGEPLDKTGLFNRLEMCYQLFMTQEMTSWARSTNQLALSLRLAPQQLEQFLLYAKSHSPGLSERIKFLEFTKNHQVPNNADVNPADRHLHPHAQVLLRLEYNKKPNRSVAEIRAMIHNTADLKKDSPHKEDIRAECQICIWWDFQNDNYNVDAERINPLYPNHEIYLLYDLVQFTISHKLKLTNMQPLAYNMWRYRPDKMDQDFKLIKDSWNSPKLLHDYAVNQVTTHIKEEDVILKQGQINEVLRKLGPLVEQWHFQEQKKMDTKAVEKQISKSLAEAQDDYEFVHHTLYFPATSHRRHVKDIINRYGAIHDKTEAAVRRHIKLIQEYEKMVEDLTQRHKVLREQRASLSKRIAWFKSINYYGRSDFTLSEDAPFDLGRAPDPPLHIKH